MSALSQLQLKDHTPDAHLPSCCSIRRMHVGVYTRPSGAYGSGLDGIPGTG